MQGMGFHIQDTSLSLSRTTPQSALSAPRLTEEGSASQTLDFEAVTMPCFDVFLEGNDASFEKMSVANLSDHSTGPSLWRTHHWYPSGRHRS